MQPDAIRVFVMDNHEIVRLGIRSLLLTAPDIEVVGDSGSAVETVRMIGELRPDIALLDARMQDGDGADVCREIRSIDPHVRALIVTSYDDEDALFSAIMAGASGFVLKQISGNSLIEGVRRVASGQSLIDPALVSKVMDRVRAGAAVGPSSGSSELTAREQLVLDRVADGLTNREIAADLGLGETTVKHCVSTILSKLGLERRAQAAVVAARARS